MTNAVIHYSHTLRGVITSHEPVDKPCSACGEIYSVPRNRARYSTRCPACQAEYVRERNAEREAARWHRKLGQAYQSSIGGAYKIIRDPRESWTVGGSLDLGELKQLAAAGYLDTGMKWSNGKTVYTVYGNRVIGEAVGI